MNSNVQLTCTVTDHDGWTNYSVSWYKNGHQIGDSKKYRTEETDSGGVLTVRRVKEYDVGQYQCAVTLGTGPARKTLKHVVNLFCKYNASLANKTIFIRDTVDEFWLTSTVSC